MFRVIPRGLTNPLSSTSTTLPRPSRTSLATNSISTTNSISRPSPSPGKPLRLARPGKSQRLESKLRPNGLPVPSRERTRSISTCGTRARPCTLTMTPRRRSRPGTRPSPRSGRFGLDARVNIRRSEWCKCLSSCRGSYLTLYSHESLHKFEVEGGLVSGTEVSRGRISIDRPNRQWGKSTCPARYLALTPRRLSLRMGAPSNHGVGRSRAIWIRRCLPATCVPMDLHDDDCVVSCLDRFSTRADLLTASTTTASCLKSLTSSRFLISSTQSMATRVSISKC